MEGSVDTVKFTINDVEVEAEKGEMLLDVATKYGIHIPTLCHHPALEPYSACRLCIVEVKKRGRSKYTASCSYPVDEGIEVRTSSEEVIKLQKMTLESLLAWAPHSEEIKNLAAQFGVKKTRFELNEDKENKCILCGLCVRVCNERMKTSAIGFANRGANREIKTPFDKLSDVCITCGACTVVCPTDAIKLENISKNKPIPILSEFDVGLSSRSAIYIPFPQAVPLKYSIDAERCLNIAEGKCGSCTEFCEPDAINYDQKDEEVKLNVGSIILSPGFKQVDPSLKTEYGWKVYDNVITGMEFERMMSASGPFQGHIQRLSDGAKPKKIAFLQCVGSRDEKIGNNYCSTICCMYSTKEAIITKEHMPEAEISIFFMDMRAMGKEFDDYYARAEKNYGIKYIRYRVQGLEETEDKRLMMHFVENGELKTEEYDLVILAMGIKPTEESARLSEVLGIELNDFGFCKTGFFSPLETSQPGIYTIGAMSGPKDIPDSVAQASGAASQAGSLVAQWRGQGLVKKEYPVEKEIEAEEPRIGAFICNCGINIGGVVDVPAVVEYAKTLPGVVYAGENLYTCSQDTQDKMKDLIEEHNLNRVVVAACTPRTHEPLFQSTIREAGLNAYLFDMANIRDQDSWVHSREPEKATEKAKDLVRMAVANANFLEPLKQQYIDIIPKGLVVGGGLAGMTAALELAGQGYEAFLIEKQPELGGNLRHLHYLLGGEEDPQQKLQEFIDKINSNDKIKVYTNTELKAVDGHIGEFRATIVQNGASDPEQILEAGAIIIATGGVEYKPNEYLYGEDDRVVTQRELETKIAKSELQDVPDSIVMVQCVGSRDDNNPWCSKVCCSTAVKNALKLKELSPTTNIYVLYKDVRTYGFREDYYNEAARQGVKFIRYDDEHKPVLKAANGGMELEVTDLVLQDTFKLNPDIVVLSTGITPPPDNEIISPMLKIPLTKDGFYLEAHMKLRPVDFGTEGIFLCGLAHSPKPVDETISQAAGAAARAVTILSKERLAISGVIAVVEPEQCAACLTCVRVCPYDVPVINSDGVAEIDPAKCQGCGTCVGECPAKAIELKHYRDEQIFAKCDGLLLEVKVKS